MCSWLCAAVLVVLASAGGRVGEVGRGAGGQQEASVLAPLACADDVKAAASYNLGTKSGEGSLTVDKKVNGR